MTTYNSYEAAKIANPGSGVYKINELFTGAAVGNNGRVDHILQPCNPADHCMTVEKFLADGHKFVDGDAYLDRAGDIEVVGKVLSASMANKKGPNDNHRYILRAAALETKEPKRTKVEYVKLDVNSQIGEFDVYYEAGPLVYLKVASIKELVRLAPNNYLYQRIETPIEWWEDAVEFMSELAELSITEDGDLQVLMLEGQIGFGMSRDKWCDFARILLEQGE